MFKPVDRDVWSKETNKNGNIKNMSDRILFGWFAFCSCGCLYCKAKQICYRSVSAQMYTICKHVCERVYSMHACLHMKCFHLYHYKVDSKYCCKKVIYRYSFCNINLSLSQSCTNICILIFCL